MSLRPLLRRPGPQPRLGPLRATLVPTPAAPATPNTPSPADTATALYTRLSWVASGQAWADLYLSTSASPSLIVAGYVGTTYVPTLLPSTTYYWKIVASNAGGSTTGPIWSFTTLADTERIVTLDGTRLTDLRVGSLTIDDVLNAQPNSATWITRRTAPAVGQAVAIGVGRLDADRLLFAGTVQTVEQGYLGQPSNETWTVTLIDPTFAVNKRRPFGVYVDVSATTIAIAVVARYAPGFTTTHVQVGLPTVSITFDGSEDLLSALSRLAGAIGGYAYPDYANDLHLFLTETADAPDALDPSNTTLQKEPPLRFSTDLSQIRTRVYGKGHSEAVPCDLAAGETIVPIADAVMFGTVTAGGSAIASTIAEGAASEVLTYSGVQRGGAGSLVGPGVSPSVAPTLAGHDGSGLGFGAYQYAYTDVTAAGETLPSPIGTVTLAVVAAPSTAPSVTAVGGSGLDAGDYTYSTTLLTGSGETTRGTNSSSVAAAQVVAPTAAVATQDASGNNAGAWAIGASVLYYVTYLNAAGETTAGSPSNTIVATVGNGGVFAALITITGIPVSSDASVTSKRLYRSVNGTVAGYLTLSAAATTQIWDGAYALTAGTPPGANTAYTRQIALTALPVGPTGTTARRLYRWSPAQPTWNLVTTLADNTTTSYTDATPNASLGAAAPTVSTATINQVAVSGIAIGPSGTTSRKVYRTAAAGAQLKLLATLADNTTTTYADSIADASLGANVPTGDTSGLTVTTGQVNAGSATLLTAASGPFAAAGGWAIVGSQFVRYTGLSGNSLTGIPASGGGAIVTTIQYGSLVLPAPALTGINANNGLARAIAKGSAVHLWVQRDDLAAQAALVVLEGGDGIREDTIVDDRRGEASLAALCDASLATFSGPIVAARYETRDLKTRSGKTVAIDFSGYAPTVRARGPLGQWRLGDPVASAAALDSSGFARDGVVVGGVTYGQAGALADGDTAALFNGTTGKITVASAALNLTGALSVEAWVKQGTLTSDGGIAGTSLPTYLAGYALTWHTDGHVYFYIGAGSNNCGAAVPSTGWHHVVGTWDGTSGVDSMKLYVDGVLAATHTSAVAVIAGTGFEIGHGNTFFTGSIDEVAVSSGVLTAAQIATDYARRTWALGDSWGLAGAFVLQRVGIRFEDPPLGPLFAVEASSVAFTLTDLLRKVVLTP